MLCEYECGQEAIYQFKNGKWCCSSYSSKCPEVRRRIKEKVQLSWDDSDSVYHTKQYKENRKKYHISQIGRTSSEEFKTRMSLKQKINWDDPNHIFNSKKFRKKLSDKHKEIWKDPSSSYNSKTRGNKISLAMNILFKDPEYLNKYKNGLKVFPNKPEIKTLSIINSITTDFEFVGDFSFWIGGKNPDFINKKNKQVIELFGDYWHSEDRTGVDNILHEQERIDHFNKYNYQCLIIWENELNNLDELKYKIKKFLKEIQNG